MGGEGSIGNGRGGEWEWRGVGKGAYRTSSAKPDTVVYLFSSTFLYILTLVLHSLQRMKEERRYPDSSKVHWAFDDVEVIR